MLIPKPLLLMLIPKPFLLVLHLMFNLSLRLFPLMCILSHRLLLSLMHHLRFLEGLPGFHTNLLIYNLIIAIKSSIHLHILFHQFLRKVLLILSIISCLTLIFPHIINTFAIPFLQLWNLLPMPKLLKTLNGGMLWQLKLLLWK